ncbi:lipoprotein signal peptidase [Gloeothece citriformis PCC 7424]|uniref:Lipoprotein signal peptidase n=1 Tax=Gloeothece citriformis (strain PCC 7424) TaxID=65393 RepID=LSPA_GLOC7|nr:signal peptidase II [Gloeothece citriformis]B7KFK1.1 RecName: Full=Lipoprotein signal peptidase; AltName: Full=Prolipoprotein signal peptidase; AltName: Full=Signal peptidase II; Short=SPase II [Gloeothece citriformis PCC 7424]ACK73326.1 lipoprotein signal peptidase [Gloeothece citriformis PCC 7424]
MMKKNRWFWLVAIIGLGLDQLTKYITVQSFETIGDTFGLWPGVFHLTYVINTGAAFSFFKGGAVWLRWLSLAVSLGLIFLGWYAPRMRIVEQLGYGFILAGALGNGIDRFLFGYVVDFLDFRLINFPVFNLADTFINIGIFFLLLASFPPKSSSQKNTSQ